MLLRLVVKEDGTIEQIVSEEMLKLDGAETVRRASNVLPLGIPKRVAFKALRRVFGDKGRVSAWTRRWRGPQIVEIIDGPTLGPFHSRTEALVREVLWLENNRF